MKNNDEMYQSVLSNLNDYLEKKKRKTLYIKRIISALACFAVSVALGLDYWKRSKKLPIIPTSPDITYESHTTSSGNTNMTTTKMGTFLTNILSNKNVTTTSEYAQKTEEPTISTIEMSSGREEYVPTEVNTTVTTVVSLIEPLTQNITSVKTTETVTTVHTVTSPQIVTSSIPNVMEGEDMALACVIIDGEYYYRRNRNDVVYTLDKFIGFGRDYEGFYQNDSSIEYYTIKERDDIVIAKMEDGSNELFIR